MATVSRRRNRYVVDWRDATGRRRWRSFTRKRDADAFRDEVSTKARRGVVVDERLTFDQLVASYRRDHWTKLRTNTRSDYDTLLRLHLEPYFRGWRVRDIRRPNVIDFRAHLVERGVGRVTINKCLTLLGGLFRFGMLNEQVGHNPTLRTKLPKPAPAEPDAITDSGEVVVLSIDEQRRLLKAAEGRWRIVILAALTTGLRQGELLGLQWGDLDLAAGLLHVRRQYTHGRFGPLKTRHARRTVPMPATLVRELKAWKLQCPKGEHDLVFPNLSGNPESHANLMQRGFHPALRRAKLRRIRFHDLRHCYVSLLIAQGVHNVKRIQTLVGHSSAKVTLDTYTHLLPDAEDGVSDAVDVALFGPAEKPATGASGSKTVAARPKSRGKRTQVLDGPCRIRTCDTRIKSPVLYQLS